MGPSKLQKAEKLGIPLVDEDAFLEMIGGGEANDSDTADTVNVVESATVADATVAAKVADEPAKTQPVIGSDGQLSLFDF